MVLYTNPDQYYWYRYYGPLYFWPILLVAVVYGLKFQSLSGLPHLCWLPSIKVATIFIPLIALSILEKCLFDHFDVLAMVLIYILCNECISQSERWMLCKQRCSSWFVSHSVCSMVPHLDIDEYLLLSHPSVEQRICSEQTSKAIPPEGKRLRGGSRKQFKYIV